jgi:hypothetical protein
MGIRSERHGSLVERDPVLLDVGGGLHVIPLEVTGNDR